MCVRVCGGVTVALSLRCLLGRLGCASSIHCSSGIGPRTRPVAPAHATAGVETLEVLASSFARRSGTDGEREFLLVRAPRWRGECLAGQAVPPRFALVGSWAGLAARTVCVRRSQSKHAPPVFNAPAVQHYLHPQTPTAPNPTRRCGTGRCAWR